MNRHQFGHRIRFLYKRTELWRTTAYTASERCGQLIANTHHRLRLEPTAILLWAAQRRCTTHAPCRDRPIDDRRSGRTTSLGVWCQSLRRTLVSVHRENNKTITRKKKNKTDKGLGRRRPPAADWRRVSSAVRRRVVVRTADRPEYCRHTGKFGRENHVTDRQRWRLVAGIRRRCRDDTTARRRRRRWRFKTSVRRNNGPENGVRRQSGGMRSARVLRTHRNRFCRQRTMQTCLNKRRIHGHFVIVQKKTRRENAVQTAM